MIQTIIRCIVVGVVLYLIWLILGWLLAGVVPAIIMTIVGVLLVLAFVLYVIRAFGITF